MLQVWVRAAILEEVRVAGCGNEIRAQMSRKAMESQPVGRPVRSVAVVMKPYKTLNPKKPTPYTLNPKAPGRFSNTAFIGASFRPLEKTKSPVTRGGAQWRALGGPRISHAQYRARKYCNRGGAVTGFAR